MSTKTTFTLTMVTASCTHEIEVIGASFGDHKQLVTFPDLHLSTTISLITICLRWTIFSDRTARRQLVYFFGLWIWRRFWCWWWGQPDCCRVACFLGAPNKRVAILFSSDADVPFRPTLSILF